MDKIHGWIDEEKWVCSKLAACMWIYSTGVITEWRKPSPEVQEYLKRRMLSILLCVNLVCAAAFDDHEWVSESTIAEQEEVMGRELGYEICIPCVLQWGMLWFSAPRQLNQTLEGGEIRSAKYHEVLNMAIAEAISLPIGGSHTPQTCMLTTVAAVLHRTPNRNWDVNKEMKGW